MTMIKALKIAAIIVVILTAALLGVQWWLGGKIRRVIEEQGSTVAGGIYT